MRRSNGRRRQGPELGCPFLALEEDAVEEPGVKMDVEIQSAPDALTVTAPRPPGARMAPGASMDDHDTLHRIAPTPVRGPDALAHRPAADVVLHPPSRPLSLSMETAGSPRSQLFALPALRRRALASAPASVVGRVVLAGPLLECLPAGGAGVCRVARHAAAEDHLATRGGGL